MTQLVTDLDDFPAGLPRRLDVPGAWYGPQLAARGGWIETLSAPELDELAAVAQPWLARVERDARALNELTPEDFPLPTLAPRLAGVTRELLHGRGFALLRGLPVDRWGARMSAVAFYGLGVHIGTPRTQNAQGHLLGHVRDLGLRSDDPNVRIYQTHERQTFHTDSADVVGLLCLQTAKSGGLSALVSSITLYNELRRRRPDLARRLFAPFATDRRGEVPPGAKPYFTIPVFNWHAGALSAIYQRQYIDSAQRFTDAPRLVPADIEALDLLDALTDDPALHLTMALERGDLQFVHNHTLLHDRTAFDDYPEEARRRHLLRLWLAPRQARPLPPVFAQRYGSVVPGARGGVRVADDVAVLPLLREWR
ncbi:MAG TPA: TauD/TfdA family dioxygenase [Casimicrobiaceae bacterium]|nr:TauD/TfdA family dioxygenase [Casimicrobiaceae bacterium]